MKKIIQLGLVAAALTSSAAFAAENSQWEIWTGSLAAVNFTSTGTTSTTQIGLGGGLLGFAPVVGYIVGNNVEVVLTPSIKSESQAGSSTFAWGFQLGVNYSFLGANMDDSAFVQAQAGLFNSGVTGTSSQFVWTAAVGKRFPLVQHVTYAPQVTYSSQAAATTGGNGSTNFAIVPLQFTLML